MKTTIKNFTCESVGALSTNEVVVPLWEMQSAKLYLNTGNLLQGLKRAFNHSVTLP